MQLKNLYLMYIFPPFSLFAITPGFIPRKHFIPPAPPVPAGATHLNPRQVLPLEPLVVLSCGLTAQVPSAPRGCEEAGDEAVTAEGENEVKLGRTSLKRHPGMRAGVGLMSIPKEKLLNAIEEPRSSKMDPFKPLERF